MQQDRVTRSRNRKFIGVTVTARDVVKRMSGTRVDLGDFNIDQCQKVKNSLTAKIENGGVCKNWNSGNVSISWFYEDIYTKFCGKMHHGHTEIGLITEHKQNKKLDCVTSSDEL